MGPEVEKVVRDNPGLVNARDNSQATPLFEAACKGKNPIATYLLDHGAHINAQSWQSYTPLHCAVLNQRVTTITLLIGRGANLTLQSSARETPLMMAERLGYKYIADVLKNGTGQ